jgi:hypothetical protein
MTSISGLGASSPPHWFGRTDLGQPQLEAATIGTTRSVLSRLALARMSVKGDMVGDMGARPQLAQNATPGLGIANHQPGSGSAQAGRAEIRGGTGASGKMWNLRPGLPTRVAQSRRGAATCCEQAAVLETGPQCSPLQILVSDRLAAFKGRQAVGPHQSSKSNSCHSDGTDNMYIVELLPQGAVMIRSRFHSPLASLLWTVGRMAHWGL